MSNPYRDKLLSIGYLSRGQTRDRRLTGEGRAHPESGHPFKTVTDESGTELTEHGRPGSGVSDRQDVHVHLAEPIQAEIEVPRDERRYPRAIE